MKVNDKDADVTLAEAYEPFKDDADVVSFNIPGVIKTALDARAQVLDIQMQMKRWKFPCDLEAKKKEIHIYVEAFKQKYDAILDHVDCLRTLRNEYDTTQQDEKVKAKRKSRYEKQKIQKLLRDGSCPEVLTEMICNSVATSLASSDGHWARQSDIPEVTDADFLAPKCLGVNPTHKTTHWHEQCTKALNVTRTEVDRQALKIKTAVEKKDSTHGSFVLETASAFVFNPEGADTIFEQTSQLPPILFSQRKYSYDVSIEAWPLQGISLFMTMATGSAFILVVPLHLVIAEEVTLKAYVADKKNRNCLLKCLTFRLDVGQSLWVPFGFVPIVIGMDAGGIESEDFTSFIVHYALNGVYDKQQDAETRMEVSSLTTKVIKKSKLLMPLKEAISKWAETLSKGT